MHTLHMLLFQKMNLPTLSFNKMKTCYTEMSMGEAQKTFVLQ